MLVLCALHVVATFTTFLSKFVSSFPFFLVARFFVGGKDFAIILFDKFLGQNERKLFQKV